MTKLAVLATLALATLTGTSAAQTHYEAAYWGCNSTVEQYETSANDRSTARSVYRLNQGPAYGGALSTLQGQYARGLRRSVNEPLTNVSVGRLIGVVRTAPDTFVATAVYPTPQGPQVETLTMVLNVGARLVIQPFNPRQRVVANCAFQIRPR